MEKKKASSDRRGENCEYVTTLQQYLSYLSE